MDPTVKYSIERLKERKGHAMRQKLERGDLQGAQAALIGEAALEELEREILAQEEMAERVRRAEEEKQAKRAARKGTRKVDRPVAVKESAA